MTMTKGADIVTCSAAASASTSARQWREAVDVLGDVPRQVFGEAQIWMDLDLDQCVESETFADSEMPHIASLCFTHGQPRLAAMGCSWMWLLVVLSWLPWNMGPGRARQPDATS